MSKAMAGTFTDYNDCGCAAMTQPHHHPRKEGAMAMTDTGSSKEQRMKQALVVTTEHRGVFFGYGEVTDGDTIRLEQCRMCVFWPAENKGVVGLAADGPKKGAKIGPPAPAMTLRGVTAVMEASEGAAKAWEKGPWS